MNLKTKVKGNLILGVYVNTRFYAIWDSLSTPTNVAVTMNIFFEDSNSERNNTFVAFDNEISKKYITIGNYKAAMDLPNCNSIAHMKDTTLLDGGDH